MGVRSPDRQVQHRSEMTAAGQAVRGPGRAKLASVRRVPDERSYLYELIQTIGAGPNLDAILRGVVRLVTEATSCHACFVYFLRDDSLELRAASSMYEHLEGKVVIPAGEGLTGWVTQTRRSAFIKENALQDPRVRRAYFPELGDEVYQSLVSVPIFSRAGDVIGAITLHADAPHEFARADLDFLEHTASLIAGAVENARLYEDATARVSLLSDLTDLGQRIAMAGGQRDLLGIVTDGVLDLLDAACAEIYLLDADGNLRLVGASPKRTDAMPLDTRKLWLSALDQRPSTAGKEDLRGLAAALWGEEIQGWPMIVPLVAGQDRLGILAVRLTSQRSDAELALADVAAHTSVALKQHQVIDRLREKNLVKDFFQALARGDATRGDAADLAARLGCDLDAAHAVLHIVPWNPPAASAPRNRGRSPKRLSWSELAGQIEGRLSARFPGLFIDNLERSIRVLLPLGDLSIDDMLGQVRQMDWGDARGDRALSVGVSNPCRGGRALARGFDEAASAAEVGALIRGAPGVTSYEGLGPYRYVIGAEDDARDGSQQRLELLVDYDARRGTQLLDTLEGYLDHRGNVVGTSRALFIHPNTLRQRLDRVERVSGIDVDREDWLSLAVATKVVKLRRMRRSAAREGGNDG